MSNTYSESIVILFDVFGSTGKYRFNKREIMHAK